MKIAVIGAGNMGGATALGLAAACPELGITVTARHAATLEKFAARGLQTSLDNVAAAREADLVVLAVKPWLAQGVLEELRPALAGKLLVSVVAGIPAAPLSPVSFSYVPWFRRHFSSRLLYIVSHYINNFLLLGVFALGCIGFNPKTFKGGLFHSKLAMFFIMATFSGRRTAPPPQDTI